MIRDGEKVRLLGPETEDAEVCAFAKRGQDDRCHFRFDALEMSDLRSSTNDLVGEMEKDLGTRLG